MTSDIQNFVRDIVRQGALKLTGRLLEVGSMDVNGSVRDFFPHVSRYTGIDMRDGKGVDLVCNAHHLDFRSNRFDIVLCLDMLEHDDAPWLTALELRRVLAPGGTLVVTAPGITFERHDYPSDYWRFTGEGIKALFPGMEAHVTDTNRHVYAIIREKDESQREI